MDRTFVVVLRATSAARFLEDDQLVVPQIAEPNGLVDVIFRTRYANEGFESEVPRELWIEVQGGGASLNEAVTLYNPQAR